MGFQPGLYWIIDPLCGWSYGALPLINRLAEDFPRQHILPGGLFIGPQRRKLDAGWLSHVDEHDARIATLTGMAFGESYRSQLLTRTDLLLDSLPATRGLLAAQGFAHPGADLSFLNGIQRAWYQDGRDITRHEVVNAVLSQSVDAGIRLEQIAENEALNAIQHGRLLMAQVSGQGFPTAAIIDKDGRYTLLPVAHYNGKPDEFFAQVKPLLMQKTL